MCSSLEANERRAEFKRNPRLEKLLFEVNANLVSAEESLLQSALIQDAKKHPLIFIMAPLRSGTTLFMQWLASTGLVAYPTNFLSRFYQAPLIGAKIQMLMTNPEYAFRDELFDLSSATNFESENGKTKGALSPNEFWYFWRRFIPFDDVDWLPDHELHKLVNKSLMAAELYGLTAIFDQPFALKGMILNYNIKFLSDLFPDAIFVSMCRDPVSNIKSILEARKRQLGGEDKWYSFRIPEYEKLKALDPLRQAAGQLFYTNKAISSGMSLLPENKKLIIRYEEFCKSPEMYHARLIEKLNLSDSIDYCGPKNFKVSEMETDRKEIFRAMQFFERD